MRVQKTSNNAPRIIQSICVIFLILLIIIVYLNDVAAILVGPGRNTKVSKVKNVVAVRINGKWQCSGVLIAPRVVLTAAHCLKKGSKMSYRNSFIVVAKNISNWRSNAYSFHSHKTHGSVDLMIINLENAVRPFNEIAFAPPNTVTTKTKVRVIGFGCTEKDRYDFGLRREAKHYLKVFSPKCHSKFAWMYDCFYPSYFVAIEKKDYNWTCKGDSGGAGMIMYKKKWMLAGIIKGGPNGMQCGGGTVFAHIGDKKIQKWINEESYGDWPPKKASFIKK